MNLQMLTVLFLLTSNQTYAQNQSKQWEAFKQIDPSYSQLAKEIPVDSMPPYRSQDGTNLCSAFAATALIEQNNCRLFPKNYCDWNNLRWRPSPLHLGAASKTKYNESEKEYNYDDNFKELPLINTGLNVFAMLIGVRKSLVHAESCYPFEQFVARHNGDNLEMRNEIERLRDVYFEKRTLADSNDTQNGFCEKCLLEDLRQSFGLPSTTSEIVKLSRAAKSFDEFLYITLFQKCRNKVLLLSPDIKNGVNEITYTQTARKADEPRPTYGRFIDKAKDILNRNIPFSLGLCLEGGPDEKGDWTDCSKKSGHSVVISGYRKLCRVSKPQDCKEMLKVHNSWGKGWQDRNNDGWVDAKNLYEHADLLPGDMAYLEQLPDKNAEAQKQALLDMIKKMTQEDQKNGKTK